MSASKRLSIPEILRHTDHREFAMPQSPWIMRQTWQDLLFAHWPTDANALRELIPRPLELDLYEGEAWVGVVPFRMSGIRPRYLPAVPWLSAFPELNVRTYVSHKGKIGVWFFSLDATNPVGVMLGRKWFNLLYYNTKMQCRQNSEIINYRSNRIHRASRPAQFKAQYKSVSEEYKASPGSLEHFLTERYCLYTVNRCCILCGTSTFLSGG